MIAQLDNVSKSYQRGKREFTVVNDVSLKIEKGDFISIIGKSGSGKTTLLNMMAGLILPTEGVIKIDGKDIKGLSDKEISSLRNEKIGYIMQEQSLLSNLTVQENVRLPSYFFRNTASYSVEDEKEIFRKLGLMSLTNVYPEELSGGELKRVAIARAVLQKPLLLLADEPTNNLDKENTELILQLFSEISESGTAIVMVTHELENITFTKTRYEMDEGILFKNEKYN